MAETGISADNRWIKGRFSMILALRRLAAYWLDFVVLAAVLVGLQLVLYKIGSGFPFDALETGAAIELWVLATMSLPVWSYFILGERRWGRTIGKRWLRLSVIGSRGGAPTLKQAFLRTLVRLVPWEMTHFIVLVPDPWWQAEQPGNMPWILLPNGLIVLYAAMLFITKGTRGVHDLLAGTRVIACENRE
jgi:uncharacterized RDD family membrane protein YckC